MPERLWNHTYDYLRDQILHMAPGANRLEPEEDLTRRLGVSRATVREATQALMKEGYVTRRHGKGNFGHPSVAQLRRRLDLTADLLQLLDTGDGPVACRSLRAGRGPCRTAMAKHFPVPCGEVYEQDWLYTVGEAPMVFCRIGLPVELFQREPQPADPDQSLYQWVSVYCGRDFAYYAAHLGCGADPDANAALDLPAGQALMEWQEIFYDLSDFPVAFCDIFFRPEADLTMVLRP